MSHLIKKYLASFAMISAAYFFFSKAVKGAINKVFWKAGMKFLLRAGLILDAIVLVKLVL